MSIDKVISRARQGTLEEEKQARFRLVCKQATAGRWEQRCGSGEARMCSHCDSQRKESCNTKEMKHWRNCVRHIASKQRHKPLNAEVLISLSNGRRKRLVGHRCQLSVFLHWTAKREASAISGRGIKSIMVTKATWVMWIVHAGESGNGGNVGNWLAV